MVVNRDGRKGRRAEGSDGGRLTRRVRDCNNVWAAVAKPLNGTAGVRGGSAAAVQWREEVFAKSVGDG
jgi:hypothetical protein